MAAALFNDLNPVAAREPATDPLVIERFLKKPAESQALVDELERLHPIVCRWIDLESSGRLAQMNETQAEGEFLHDIFGEVLGYANFAEGLDEWHLQAKYTVAKNHTPDAILGDFKQLSGKQKHKPRAIVELKGPRVHLDRDRSNGRTAVQQCWDYLVTVDRACRWGIVTNMVSFRLYERDNTPRKYQHFSLQSLRDIKQFGRFFVLFHRKGLLEQSIDPDRHAAKLLDKTVTRQKKVGSDLYDYYSRERLNLIGHLTANHDQPLEDAIRMAQLLIDRIIFIAFCEDRELLPKNTINKVYSNPGFRAVTNPRWQNFKDLFRMVDQGHETIDLDVGFNGGLFAPHPVDDLELPDEPWTNFFDGIGGFDFSDEVNLDVLGHLFEQSITEVERIRERGLFLAGEERIREFATMPQSAKRKQLGVYYTPPELTSRIVRYTVDELIGQRILDLAVDYGVKKADAKKGRLPEGDATGLFWRAVIAMLRDIKVLDPACGSGAFLFQAYNALEARYFEAANGLRSTGASGDADFAAEVEASVPDYILEDNLFGVDLSKEAVEITQLALWIRSAVRGRTLNTLSQNIVHGNSLVADKEADPHAVDWRQVFLSVFDRSGYRDTGGGFDCVIGNPPWERIKLQEREFFSLPAPEIATATNAAKRRQLVGALAKQNPELHQLYVNEHEAAARLLDHCRKSGDYPLTGRGDINTYAVFCELAYKLVAPSGRVGLLCPSGIASDKTTMDFFAALAETDRLLRFFDFENRLKHFFPDVDGRFKFCILNFGGDAVTTHLINSGETDFVFFAHRVEELEDPRRHVKLSGDDIRLLNPNTRTCPIFRSRRDAEITKSIYRRVPVLIDRTRKGPTGNPWSLKFKTMFHQTNDAELFREADQLKAERFKLDGNRWVKGAGRKRQIYLPLYEAKMVQAFDHRAASVVTESSNWMRQGQTDHASLVEHQNPEHLAVPRYWVNVSEVDLPEVGIAGFKDITSPTNQRTMIASWAPIAGFTNHFVLVSSSKSTQLQLCLNANLNAFVFDYVTRQKIGGVTLNFFIVEQLPTLSPLVYGGKCAWDRELTLESWISERVLKLTCTAEDMLPLADACAFSSGSFAEYDGRLNRWDPAERAQLRAELDAAFFHLYGIDRGDAAYILSTFQGVDSPQPGLPGTQSVAELVLDTYDWLAAQSR